MKTRTRLAPGRWRCHAAAAGGDVIAPALIIVAPSGEAEAEPFAGETFATRDVNGAVAIVPPDSAGLLPQSLPPVGLRASLALLAPMTAERGAAIFIPFC